VKKVEKGANGTVIRTETSPDRSSYKQNNTEALMGKKCGGGPRDVSHSLSGAGMTVDYMEKSGKGGKKRKY
jgi:hypothetical protein